MTDKTQAWIDETVRTNPREMTAPLPIRTIIQDRLTVSAPRQGLHEITGDSAPLTGYFLSSRSPDSWRFLFSSRI